MIGRRRLQPASTAPLKEKKQFGPATGTSPLATPPPPTRRPRPGVTLRTPTRPTWQGAGESRHALPPTAARRGLPFAVAAPPPSRRVAGVPAPVVVGRLATAGGRHQIRRAHPFGPVLTGGGLARRHGGRPRRRAGGSPRARQEPAPPSTSPAEPPLPRVAVRALIAPLAPEVRGGVWESGADPRGGELAGRAPEPTTSTAAAEQQTRRGRGKSAPLVAS